MENFSDHPSARGIASRQVLEHPFTFEPVSSTYVKEILENLNPRKAVGADGISPRLLRLAAQVLAGRLHALLTFWSLTALGQTNGCAGIWHPCQRELSKRELSPCVGQWESYVRSTLRHSLSPLVTKLLWISKEPFLLHRSSENNRGLEREPWQQRVSHGRGRWFIKGFWLY